MSRAMQEALDAVGQMRPRYGKGQLVLDGWGDLYRVLHVTCDVMGWVYTIENRKGIAEGSSPYAVREDFVEGVVLSRQEVKRMLRVV